MGLKKFLFRFWKRDSHRKISWIEKYLQKDDRILDLGCGPCWVTSILKHEGYNITPVDIKNLSVIKDIKPITYNGKTMPFKENEFDLTLILTVLHHVKDPISLLKNTKRISKKIVIIEDIHSNDLQKYIIKILDSLVNLEFRDHPHNNLNDKGWKDLFRELDLTLVDSQYHKIAGLFTQAIYHVVRDE